MITPPISGIKERTERWRGNYLQTGLVPLQALNLGGGLTTPQWTHLVTNGRSDTITAASGRYDCPADVPQPWGGFQFDGLTIYGGQVLPPGRTMSLMMATNQARCIGVVETVVLADGSFLGDRRAAEQIYARRRGLALEIPSVVARLRTVALGEQTPEDLSSKLLKEDDAVLTSRSVLERSGREIVLDLTARLLIRRELPQKREEVPSSPWPTQETLMKKMHVSADQAIAATLMHDWSEWETLVKPFVGDRMEELSLPPATEVASEASPVLHEHPGSSATLPPIPSSEHCPIKLSAVRTREEGFEAGQQIVIRFDSIMGDGEIVFHGRPASTRAPRGESDGQEEIAQSEQVMKNTVGFSGMPRNVGQVRWFEITRMRGLGFRPEFRASTNKRCVYVPLNPDHGVDWQSVMDRTKPMQYVAPGGR